MEQALSTARQQLEEERLRAAVEIAALRNDMEDASAAAHRGRIKLELELAEVTTRHGCV